MATKRIIDHVEHLRARPEHVRRRIALATSIGVTSLVALGWVVALTTSGTLALKSDDALAQVPSQVGADLAQTSAETQNNFSGLLGAANAAIEGSSSPADLTIVQTQASSTLDRPDPSTQTVIPF